MNLSFYRGWYILVVLLSFVLISNCSDKKEPEKKTIKIGTEKKQTSTNAASEPSVPVQLNNKGVGPITSVTFDEDINQDMASKGEEIFKAKCVACHKPNKKYIGPAMAGIYEKRSPEWVMNMIMNPDGMVKKDPVAKALFEAYNKTIMINQNIPREEARALAEWFRTLE